MSELSKDLDLMAKHFVNALGLQNLTKDVERCHRHCSHQCRFLMNPCYYLILFEFIRVCPCSCHWAGQEVKKELGFLGRMKSEYLVKKEKENPSELMVRALWCYVAASNESMSVWLLRLFAVERFIFMIFWHLGDCCQVNYYGDWF